LEQGAGGKEQEGGAGILPAPSDGSRQRVDGGSWIVDSTETWCCRDKGNNLFQDMGDRWVLLLLVVVESQAGKR
jgi:hypothetical protein